MFISLASEGIFGHPFLSRRLFSVGGGVFFVCLLFLFLQRNLQNQMGKDKYLFES